MSVRHAILPVLLLATPPVVRAGELKLAGIFTDHAVLQRDAAVPVWGWADAGEQVTVGFAGRKKAATAGADGKWLVRLDAMPACAESRELVVTAANRSVTLKDVVVGDVWLCSGQSNMGISMGVPGNDFLKECIAKAGNPQLRLFATLHQFPDQPVADTAGRWATATPETVRNWIAIGYLFGDRIQREVGVPVGILASCMGGTMIENWLPRPVLEADPDHAPFLKRHAEAVQRLPEAQKKYGKAVAEFKARFPDDATLQAENAARRGRGETLLVKPHEPEGGPGSPRKPSACYNGKIAPILPYALKGVLWYQGEGNVGGFDRYPGQMADLMRVWREGFESPELPFIATELAPFGQPSPLPQDSARARFGEALGKVEKSDGNAWVITIVDGGDPVDIHPARKEIPAERFAAMALARVYGRTGMAHGPRVASWKNEGGKAVVKFTSCGEGLTAEGVVSGGHALTADKLEGFEIAGADRRFVRAQAHITAPDTVMVQSPDVPQPAAVRYAWAAFPLCNLFNTAGFAAYPFRTDDWPWPTPPEETKKRP